MTGRRASMLAAWRRAVDLDPELTTASTIVRTQFLDHIPAVLDAFERRLTAEEGEEKAEAIADQKEHAAEHGLHRWQQGYTGPGFKTHSATPLERVLKEATAESQAVEERAQAEGQSAARIDPAPTLASQTSRSVRPVPSGEGMGLAIVKRLCELLDASLELETAEGEGTTFRVTFPRAYKELVPAAAEVRPPNGGENASVRVMLGCRGQVLAAAGIGPFSARIELLPPPRDAGCDCNGSDPGMSLAGGALTSQSLRLVSQDGGMLKQKRRLNVTHKIALGLTLIIAIGMVSMLLIYRGLDAVEGSVHRLAAVEAPLSAAAYEMELNVNGFGLAVLKYLATRRPDYRRWAQKDELDFAQYHASYMELVRTERERSLGQQVGKVHGEFRTLGHALMGHADRQETLYASIAESIEEMDYIIDARLQPGLFNPHSARDGGFGAAVATADMEAEAAEVGFWVVNYHRQPTPEAKRTVLSKLAVLERTLANFRTYRLTPAERRHAQALRSTTTRINTAVHDVLGLEDQIHAGRQRFIELRASMDRVLDDEIQVLALRGMDLPREQAERAAHDVLDIMGYLIPLFVLAAGVVGFLLVHMIRTRVTELDRGTQAIAHGDLEYRIGTSANDEFGDLARRFNRMVDQLQATTVSKNLLAQSEETLRGTVAELRREIDERMRAEREREKLQAQLRRSETMSAMGALVAGVAHEVRNPLFGISSTLDAMSARLGETAEHQRYLGVLRTEVDRLSKLMGDLLSYGRPPAHEFTVAPIGPVISQAVAACRALAERTGTVVANGADGERTAVRLDSTRLGQVFQNLVDNALQNSPPRSEVRIVAERTQGEGDGQSWLECRVEDQGCGFQPEDLPRVFDPFFTRRRGGTGLGLSIVQRIVDEHGGRVSAANRPGGGAIMTVRLPIADT